MPFDVDGTGPTAPPLPCHAGAVRRALRARGGATLPPVVVQTKERGLPSSVPLSWHAGAVPKPPPVPQLRRSRLLGALAHGVDLLLAHGAQHGHHQLLALVELRLDLRSQRRSTGAARYSTSDPRAREPVPSLGLRHGRAARHGALALSPAEASAEAG